IGSRPRALALAVPAEVERHLGPGQERREHHEVAAAAGEAVAEDGDRLAPAEHLHRQIDPVGLDGWHGGEGYRSAPARERRHRWCTTLSGGSTAHTTSRDASEGPCSVRTSGRWGPSAPGSWGRASTRCWPAPVPGPCSWRAT